MKKFVVFFTLVLSSTFASAATISCNFISETKMKTTGEWLPSETDLMELLGMFGDGLELKLENSLLGKLDSKEPFYAGSVKRGDVYLKGGTGGVEGKLTHVKGDVITFYDGMCTVSFG